MPADQRPLILRVLEFLRSAANDQGWVETSNRELERALHYSRGAFPAVIRDLEAQKVLSRELTDTGTQYHIDHAAAERFLMTYTERQKTDVAAQLFATLRALADADGRGHVTNSVLRKRLGYKSVGQLPALWRELETDKRLVREQKDRMGTTYRLLAPGEEPPQIAVTSASRRQATKNVLDDLERLGSLKERKLLTESEFALLKHRILGDQRNK